MSNSYQTVQCVVFVMHDTFFAKVLQTVAYCIVFLVVVLQVYKMFTNLNKFCEIQCGPKIHPYNNINYLSTEITDNLL